MVQPSVENILAVPPKVKHGITIKLSNSTTRYPGQRIKDGYPNTCRCRFKAVLDATVKGGNDPTVHPHVHGQTQSGIYHMQQNMTQSQKGSHDTQ